jgi:hypothetical protein
MWYQPPLTGLYISVLAILGAIGVLGLIFVRGTKQSTSAA